MTSTSASRGLAEPVPDVGEPLAVRRAFAFIDVCGFTAYCDQYGEAAAIEVLAKFRSTTRHVVGQRGVRVAKWLGDGVLLVGMDLGPLVAASVELVSRFRPTGVDTHVGIASGHVLLFEGDDYVGRPVNLASRLCDSAGPNEILAVEPLGDLPAWIRESGKVVVHIPGVGELSDVARLVARPDVEALLAGTASAA